MKKILGGLCGIFVFGLFLEMAKNVTHPLAVQVLNVLGVVMGIVVAWKIGFKHKKSAKNGLNRAKKASRALRIGKRGTLRGLIEDHVFSADSEELRAVIQSFAAEKGMTEEQVRKAVAASIPVIIEDALDDGILTHEEQERIEALLQAYDLNAAAIGSRGNELLVRGALIRDLLEGTVRPRVNVANLPVKLMKGEVPIWGYSNMPIAEKRTVSQFVGGSQGVSIRVAKGVYWRVGKTTAQRVTSEEIKDIGQGAVLITSHHLYYLVGGDSRRIKHDKIFSVARYADAVMVHMDGANAKPLILKTDDSWFLVNILQNAQNWA